MSTEKQNVLVLPEFAQFSVTERGIEIINDGDIVVRAKFPGGVIRSLNGDIYIFSSAGEKQSLAQVEAPNGMVKVIGDDFEIMEIRAKEVILDTRSILTKIVRVDADIKINRGRFQANATSAHSLHFSGTEFISQHVGVQETASFIGETLQVQVITGSQIDLQLRGSVKIGKLTAHTEACLSAKTVDIDYLSTKNLKVTPQTQGVIVCLDGPAPSEPNSIVGLLSPSIFLEKIPSLTGLIRELQTTQQEKQLTTGNAVDINVDEVNTEVKEKEKSALLEKPPEFYRTSTEIPIPYRELAAKQNAIIAAREEAALSAEQTPSFEPDLSPSEPLFEPDLSPSTPLFEPPNLTEPLFDPNKFDNVKLEKENKVEIKVEDKIENKDIKKDESEVRHFALENSSPLDLPPLAREEILHINDSNPLNLNTDGIIDLGLDSTSKDK